MPLPGELRASRLELEVHSRKHAAGVYYGDHRLLCRLLGDFLAFVDTRDLMLGPRLVLDGFWEAWVTLAIARHLQPGSWYVDVGANYGYYTLLMAGACGPAGRADWPRLDLVKIDAEGAEALVWEGMQETLCRFPHAAVVLERHLQRDSPQTVGFLHQLQRAGYSLRSIGYEGDVVPTDAATILGQRQEHWALWLSRR